MGWLDNWIAELTPAHSMPATLPPVAKLVRPRQPKPEIKSVWVQTRAPRNGDTGEAEIAFYSVADGVLTMRDEKGQPNGKDYPLGPGDDARKIAGRLAREAWLKDRGGEFNRPLHYPQPSVA
jgi:hypothetical protein